MTVALLALLPYAAWGAFVLTLFAIAILILPNGADYPVPTEALDGIRTIYEWMYSFNLLFPVDTFIDVVYYGMWILVVTRVMWPFVFWLFKSLTGGGQ